MKEFSYVIKDEMRIHARPAGLLVKKASEYQSNITIKKESKTADAKKIFAIMSLGIKFGDTITVEISGDDEAKAAKILEEFIKESM